MAKVFSKNSIFDFDHVLKFWSHDIITPNFSVKLYQNLSISKGTRALTKYFLLKNSKCYLGLGPTMLKYQFIQDIVILNIYVNLY